jgi:hypothetical protein
MIHTIHQQHVKEWTALQAEGFRGLPEIMGSGKCHLEPMYDLMRLTAVLVDKQFGY